MTRRTRLAAAVALALTLTACGGGEDADDPTVAASGGAEQAAPQCPTETAEIPAPEGVGVDVDVRPKVPANTAAVPTVVQVADVVEGSGEQAEAGDAVAVKYVGALDKNGKEFDASWNTSPEQTIDFTVCGQDVVAGFSVAPLGMKVGGRRLVRIPDAFGYPGGNPQAGIGAGDAITFVIDLVEVR